MRLTTHANKLESNVTGETQNFGIGDASVVIDILRNRLYEHKIQTLVQEYICNGRDAMREVKSKGQLEVSVPTTLSPVFKVRDFGPGISPDRMANVFVNYGASTKRGTNNQTGGFGIGAKSAWSYTDSFTIITHIDGVKRTYVAHTGVNNNGRLDHVDTGVTVEKNGTEIHVPVQRQDVSEFTTAIYRAIYFWEERPVIKGDTNPVHELISGLRLSDELEIVSNSMLPSFVGGGRYSDGEMTAVIDGVVYPIGRSLRDKVKELYQLQQLLRDNMKVIFHIGNGLVEVSASRESIADSKHTVAALTRLAKEALKLTQDYLKSEWAKVNSTSEFFETYLRLSENFLTDKYAKYDKYSISGSTVESELFGKVKVTKVSTLGRYSRRVEKITKNEMHAGKSLSLRHLPHTFFLEKEETLVKLNKRFREYLRAPNDTLYIIEPKLEVVTPAVVDKDGVTTKAAVLALDMVSYEKVKADLNVRDVLSLTWTEEVKLKTARVRKEKDEICVQTPSYPSGQRHTYITIDTNESKYLYVPMVKNAWPENFTAEDVRVLSKHLEKKKDVVVCGLSEKLIKKVESDENFSPLSVWLDNWKPTKKEVNFVKYQSSKNMDGMKIVSMLKGLEDQFLLDMTLEYKRFIKSENTDDGLEPLPEILIKKVQEMPEYKQFVENDEKLEKILKQKYPLLDEIGSYRMEKMQEEIAVYINAKHNMKKSA